MSPDDPRVFDFKKNSPSPTSKPIITGHRPMMPDPMLHRMPSPEPAPQAQPPIEHATVNPGSTVEPHNFQPQIQPPVMPTLPSVPPVSSALPPQTTPQPLQPNPLLSDDLKVELPAGEAAYHNGNGVWFVLAIVLVIVGVVIFYLFG